ncbi:cupin domain-containing protein [Ningiella sp. W23]|uniref:cupin domain-containing protein n=1 Tax=Ningiella sp. W23 TaxID=3023715 RepID=UPI003756BEED
MNDDMHPRIQALIGLFNLQPHPEGGYYSEEYRSEEQVASYVDSEKRASVSHIYFLLARGQVSRWHKVLHDEIWNVYEGDPLRILTLSTKDNSNRLADDIIGKQNTQGREDYFKVITGGDYQAAESTGAYTFVGCSVAPGFEFRDFSYIEDEATRAIVKDYKKDYQKFL